MRGGVWLYERGREQRRREDQCEQTGRRHSAVGRQNVVGAISNFLHVRGFWHKYFGESGLLENEPTVPAEQAHTTQRQ